MANNNEISNNGSKKNGSKFTVILLVIIGVLLVAVVAMVLIMVLPGEQPPETLPPTDPTEPSTEPVTEAPTDPEHVMLPAMAELYEQNPDTAGWLKIDDTNIDYPLMYAPDEKDKYLHLDFDEQYSFAGLPFIDDDCSIDPESDNLIIYGHNMNDGSMFQNLMNYAKEEYWEEHPTIALTTLYEEREYEIVAAFYDRVYYNYEDVFKFYQFIDAEDEEDFNEAITYYKENAVYETGVTAEYGDKLITLVTCSYHCDYGRFVVVARYATEEPADTAE